MKDFRTHFGNHLDANSCQSWFFFLMCFRDGFVEWFSGGLGHVWGEFLVPKREAKGKGSSCGNVLFYLSSVCVFVVCGRDVGCQSERKTEWDSDIN